MIPQGYSSEVEAITLPTKTYHFDFEKKRIVGFIDHKVALRQAIFKILQTERYKYLIYSPRYGVQLEELIGKDKDYAKSQIKRMVYEALLQDDRILDVTDFDFLYGFDDITTSFVVHTIYGLIEMEGVTIHV